MKYNFDEEINRKNTDSMKWDHMDIMDTRASQDTLPLWVADMEFKVADEIVDSIIERAKHGVFGYTIPTDDYYNSIIDWYKRRHNWQIKKDSIFYAPSLVTALSMLVSSLTEDGDGIIIQPPVYYPFESLINNNKRKLVKNNLINNNNYYSIDFDDLKEKSNKPENKLMIFCTPHNPVGRVWSTDEILEVIKICKETNTILIADEIHCDILRKDIKHTPLMSLAEDTNNIISVIAPSKTFNLAGMQMSQVIIEDDCLREKYYDIAIKQYAFKYYPPLGLAGLIAAYNYGEEWLDQVLDYIDNNLIYMKTFLDEKLPDAKFIIPEGTYLTWIDLSKYGNADEIQSKLVLDGKLLIENGNIFGEVGDGFFRINVACPRPQLEKCLNIIYEQLNN